MSDFEERAAAWSQPISEDSPCGEDCTYEDDLEAVKGEVDKLQSLAGQLPNWPEVVKRSTEMLSTRTKDTNLLTALCAGLFCTEGYSGLAAGLTAFRTIVDNYWDKLYPKRVKPRSGHYTWMVQYLTKLTADPENEPKSSDHEAMVVCLDQFTPLDNFLKQQFDTPPAVGPLKQTLQYYIEQNAPAAAPEPEPATEAGDDAVAQWAEGDPTPRDSPPIAQVVTAVSDLGGIPSKISNDTQAEQVVEKATEALKLASEYYQKRAEQWEAEKKRLEDQLAHAGRVIKLEGQVKARLAGEGEDDDEEDDD